MSVAEIPFLSRGAQTRTWQTLHDIAIIYHIGRLFSYKEKNPSTHRCGDWKTSMGQNGGGLQTSGTWLVPL